MNLYLFNPFWPTEKCEVLLYSGRPVGTDLPPYFLEVETTNRRVSKCTDALRCRETLLTDRIR